MNPVPPISTFAISALETGTEYRIDVAGPDVASQPGPWPAVIFLDGDDQFRFAVEGYQAARTRGLIPPLW